MKSDILLESGTGELEILEFKVNEKYYAINVIKIKEILDAQKITKLPQMNPAVEGIILCRGDIITLVNLKYVLENEKYDELKDYKIVLCEFNKIKVAFIIDSVIGVHRIKWEQIRKPDTAWTSPLVIGNIVLDEDVIFLLDFEKIVTDINPSTGINEDKVVDVDYKERPNIKVVLADDSPLIRKLLNDTLTKAGFKKLKFFDDGKQAYDYLFKLKDEKNINFMEDVHLLITDIEMPQMDGHTLTRKIKEDPILKRLPVIIFSSLITDDLKHKGQSVGADAQLSKPEIGELIDVVDKIIKVNK